jgi:heptosyltransferase III
VERFTDQPLGARPHIAVFGSDKVGNFVVTTPLLRGLLEKYPDATVDFFGSVITADLELNCPYIHARFTMYGATGDILGDFHDFVTRRVTEIGPYALAINCDGFSPLTQALIPLIRPRFAAGQVLRADLRVPLAFSEGDPRGEILKDRDWNGPEMVARHPKLLTSNYFGELLCRMAYVETDFFHVEVGSEPPPFDVPDVLVHLTTTRPAKMWLPEHWRVFLNWCDSEKISVGLVGSKPETERELYGGGFEETLLTETKLIDLRGRTKLTELAGAFRLARAAVVVDAGPLHLAVGVGCPTIALFGNDAEGNGASPVRLWGPRAKNVLPVVSAETCTVCVENRFQNAGCLVPGHPCMRGLHPSEVVAALARALDQ